MVKMESANTMNVNQEMCIGNLVTEAGLLVSECKSYIHKWPPKYRLIAKYGGRKLFDIACRIYGHIARSWFQALVIVEKANASKPRDFS